MSKETELVKAQAEYIEFLQQAYNNAFSVAYNHSYREPAELVQRGIRFRERIAALNSSNQEQQGVQDESWKEKFEYWLTNSMYINKSTASLIIDHVERYCLAKSSPVSAGESAGVKEIAIERLIVRKKIIEKRFDYELSPNTKIAFDAMILTIDEAINEVMSIPSTPSADADYWKQEYEKMKNK